LTARIGSLAAQGVPETLREGGTLGTEPGGRSWMIVVDKPDKLVLTTCKLFPRFMPKDERKAARRTGEGAGRGRRRRDGVKKAIRGAEATVAQLTPD